MVKFAALAVFLAAWTASLPAAEKPRAQVLVTVDKVPTALDPAFEFRKTKIFHLTDQRQGFETAASLSRAGKATKPTRGSKDEGTDASIAFEKQYRLFGAVTDYDRRQRFGTYFDFFWRSRREGEVTVRLEYRQEKTRSLLQAREVRYPDGRGSHKTEFALIGDDYQDEGRVIAWRCLLLADGRIVAEERSYLWR